MLCIHKSKVAYFLFLSDLDAEFVDLIQHRFKRAVPPTVLADIDDGAVYKEMSQFFNDKFNVSFALNYDGAPVFKSSDVQIWPVQLYVNELPPHLR